MKVLTDLNSIGTALSYPIMAIGVFDGVHLGHREIVRNVVERARNQGGTPILLSFHPHPQQVISLKEAPRLIQTFEQRAEMLEELGIKIFVRYPFTRALSLLSPAEFVERVVMAHGIREIHVGANFRFGHRRQGNLETLKQLGARGGFTVHCAGARSFRGQRISSTRIRKAVGEGRVALAKRLLGRPYEMRGNIVKGAQKGNQLGFPTANLASENDLMPATGVYATRAHIDGAVYLGATNVGFRPTVHALAEPKPVIETHLLDFSGNVYGQAMKLDFCFRIRDERRFPGLEHLLNQIRIDVHRLRRYAGRVSSILEGKI